MTKTKNTKRTLLLSILSLTVCVSMLVGSTFAWFTDSVASGSNVITAGNLDLAVEYTLDGKSWESLDGATGLFQKGLWEPGHTEVIALRIKNNGTLSLKYAASMNILDETIGKTVEGDEIVLSDVLTVSTLVQQAIDETGAENQIGNISLSLAFADENRLLYQNTTSFKAGNVLGENKELASGAAHYLFVKVDMAETVGNEANHNGTDIPAIHFGINVLATQNTGESDSFGNQYDADSLYPVIDEESFLNAVASGRDVKFDADIVLTKTVSIDDDVKIVLNGYDLDASAIDSALVVNAGKQATILVEGTDEEVKLGKNGLVSVAAGADAFIEINGGNFVSDDTGSTLIKPDGTGNIQIVLNNVQYKSTASNSYALDCSYYDGENLTVSIVGGSFEATSGLLLSGGSSVVGATVIAKNEKNMQPAVYAMGDVTVENCVIKAEKTHAVAVAGGATITVKNCEVYAGSDAGALAFQVYSSGGTINVTDTVYTGGYGATGRINSGCVAVIRIDGTEVYRKG